eukprot:m.22589 g.22589  ORF g.22589 m.22589 type:complete len:596 (+) comp28364_c0_seq2:538-2325(+)
MRCAPEPNPAFSDDEKDGNDAGIADKGEKNPSELSIAIGRQSSPTGIVRNVEGSETFVSLARRKGLTGDEVLSMGKNKSGLLTSWLVVTDNKMALKLFGSKRAIETEQVRQQRSSPWIIHPCSSFRMYWDVVILFVLAVNVILLPVVIAFFSDELSTHWIVLNSITDVVFLTDVIINFRTGILTDGRGQELVILNSRTIAIRYLKTWFALDAVASIPFDSISKIFLDEDNHSSLLRASKALKALRVTKLLSLLRLLRLSRLKRFLDKWEEAFSMTKALFQILKLVGVMLLLAHWSGCVQFMVPFMQGFPEDSWVAINHLQDSPVGVRYTWSVFKSLSHMLCIGYGRFPPMNVSDAWLTIISMLLGASFYALFIGHISSHILTANSPTRLFEAKINQVQEYMQHHKLPMGTRSRVTKYFTHKYEGRLFDEQEILSELSDSLRSEVVGFNCQGLVESVPLFNNADPYFIQMIVTRLCFEVFLPDDIIIKVGTVGDKMYFIREGIVDVIDESGEVFTSLTEGSYIGEICLLGRTRRVATVKAVTICDLYSLSLEHFNAAVEEFPDMRITLERVAVERLAKLDKTKQERSTREMTTDVK